MIEQTLSMIKPDAVNGNHIGEIIDLFEKNGLKVIASRMIHLSLEQAKRFYSIHKDRPFFSDLVNFVSSGPVLAMVLEGENAIEKNRKIMGATDPKKAEKGTIRAKFAKSIDQNAVHGSDAKETAKVEIAFFFSELEIFSKRHA